MTDSALDDQIAEARSRDRPDVLIFPPLIPLATVMAGCGLQWLAPLGGLAKFDSGLRWGIGAVVLVTGLLMAAAGKFALKRHGTNISPLHPSTALVTDGIFERTRNPLYVGMTVALCGIAVILALDWIPLLLVPACFVLHFAVVRPEEGYLERKFGDAYCAYRQRVPRYLPGS